jgi:catechol 2,3-dioxygenase-like lactoylglutathione lyase family enzyme
MEPHITLVTLGVADLGRAVRFYGEGLGLPRREPQLTGVAFFRMAGAWLSLFPRDALAADATVASDGSGFRAFTLAHNVPSAADVDRVLAEAVAAGATLVKPAATASWGGYSGYFADPDGFLWEVAWNPHVTFD